MSGIEYKSNISFAQLWVLACTPNLIHCFVDHRLCVADPLSLLLTQNDSSLVAILPGAL